MKMLTQYAGWHYITVTPWAGLSVSYFEGWNYCFEEIDTTFQLLKNLEKFTDQPSAQCDIVLTDVSELEGVG